MAIEMQRLLQDSPTTFKHAETVTGGATSVPLFVPGGVSRIQYMVQPANSVKVEVTVSGVSKVVAETAFWLEVADLSVDTLGSVTLPVTAVRFIAVTGDCVVEVLGAFGG